MTFTIPSGYIIIFSGFKSLWTIPFYLSSFNALISWKIMLVVYESVSELGHPISAKISPSICSRTRKNELADSKISSILQNLLLFESDCNIVSSLRKLSKASYP